MNEYTDTVKWLKYLLYVGIAAMVNTVLNIFLPVIASWLSPILTLAALYMMARLSASNGRYMRCILFTGVALVINVLNIQQVALAGSICSILGQYQEFTAHGELIRELDKKLSDKWGGLFWLQFAVSVISTLLGSMFAAVLVASGSVDAATASSMILVAVTLVTLLLRLLYLAYLRKSIKVLEAVVE
jgi:hypothetical protein